jgi:hypothetical protein
MVTSNNPELAEFFDYDEVERDIYMETQWAKLIEEGPELLEEESA